MKNTVDFAINAKKGEKFTVLQITDMQIIDASQRRYPERLSAGELEIYKTELTDKNCYSHIRDLVEKAKPDLIIITGDIVYGSFDDSGRILDEFIAFMESLGVPWAPVYGNHDNESYIGVVEQCRRYSAAPNCLFARGSVTGNCNYTVGLYDEGELFRVLYMVDSNGCGGTDQPAVRREKGFGEDQVAWLRDTADALRRETGKAVPGFFCCHIPTGDVVDAFLAGGYHTEEDFDTLGDFEIGVDRPVHTEGDCGFKSERANYNNCTERMAEHFHYMGVDGVFVGHHHKINTSVYYDGIRYTFGVKTGIYDYHIQLGGTCITIPEDRRGFDVKPLYQKL